MEKRKDYEIAAENFAALTSDLGLDIQATFVPQSQSRNAGESALSLNWRCAVTRSGKAVHGLESVDYMQGIGHAPSHTLPHKFSDGRIDKFVQQHRAKAEAESGKRSLIREPGTGAFSPTGEALTVAADDVLQSLCCDADVLDYPLFEEWASNFGFDSDSRKGEAIYRQCLAFALALRAAIGDPALAKLRAFAAEM